MLYLASQSPRRRDLLDVLSVPFSVLPSVQGVDMEALEHIRGKEAPLRYVRRVTQAKLQAALAQLGARSGGAAVLVADTTVALGRTILGKPLNANANAHMLRSLQGRSHNVLSAVALYAKGQTHSAVSLSKVQFAPLSEARIQAYAVSGEGWDKAGGYAIQGQAAAFVQRIQGNYTGIVGLPLYETAQLLGAAGLLVL